MKKRLCLGIETTGSYLGLALHDLGAPGAPCLTRHFAPAEGQQAELLFPTLSKLMKAARLKRADIAAIAVDHGPGSFTGVRIGVASARALAQALSVPLLGVSSLEAMAWACDVPDKDAVIIARIPAVAGEAYHAAFRWNAKGKWTQLSRPAWTREDGFHKLITRAPQPVALVMVEKNQDEEVPVPEGTAVRRIPSADPSALVSLAIARFGPRFSMKAHPHDGVAPVYLQPSWAERRPSKRA